MKDDFILLPSYFILVTRQWLCHAAFVALTVAGQQGNSLPPHLPTTNFGFWIADFGLRVQSKIQNRKSKIGGGPGGWVSHPFPLHPSAADDYASLCLLKSRF